MGALRVVIDGRLMFYRKAGIAFYTRRLVSALASLQGDTFSLRVLLDRRDTDTGWLPAQVGVIRTVTPAHHRFERFALPLELARHRIDVLHSPDFIGCAGRFHTVITVHDLYFLENPAVMGIDGARYYADTPAWVRRADAVIAVSGFTRDQIRQFVSDVSANKLHVIHEAADFPGSARPAADAEATPPYLLFVGTFEPRKNLATLLHAMTLVPESRLMLVGESGWGGVLPEARDRVHLAGRVSDAELDVLYRGARALVLPSLSEGFGLTALEAMTRGVPVICADSGALPEVTGDAAMRHPPLDAGALAAHIRAVWHDADLRSDLRERGLARAAQFSWARAAEDTLQVYRAVAA
jgi:glycosyltransferase involved in cell wall biosynthesis